MTLTHIVTLVSLLAFSPVRNVPPVESKVLSVNRQNQEIGLASYYGDAFHGGITASGKLFDQYKLTAAHRTLPFGTRLRVTNLRNNRNVVVTITDRGPVLKDRILDLSFASAKELRMLNSGVVKVSAEVLH
jgi:rare lipoprotein A